MCTTTVFLNFLPKKKIKNEKPFKVVHLPLYSHNKVLIYSIIYRDEGRWDGHTRMKNDCKMQISEAEMKRSLLFIGLQCILQHSCNHDHINQNTMVLYLQGSDNNISFYNKMGISKIHLLLQSFQTPFIFKYPANLFT
jgi:hypothetical protein